MRRSRHGITDFLSLINLENSICDYLNAGACSFFGPGDRAVAGITLLAREASLAWAGLAVLRARNGGGPSTPMQSGPQDKQAAALPDWIAARDAFVAAHFSAPFVARQTPMAV